MSMFMSYECFTETMKFQSLLIMAYSVKPYGQSPTAKRSRIETNPENTQSHKMTHISSSRGDKSNL